jgi:hypothetical protein
VKNQEHSPQITHLSWGRLEVEGKAKPYKDAKLFPIGMRGPIARPEFCNGLMVPIVVFDQVYSFDRAALIKAIPRPEKMTEKQFGGAAGEVFDRILQMTDNPGATDDTGR